MIITILAVSTCLLVTISIHAEGLSIIRFDMAHRPIGERLKLIIVVSFAILLHVIEIGFYAIAIWILNIVVNVGDLVGAREFSGMDYFYYSAETFTALGSGDLSTTGGLRLIASLEPLNGLVLIAWTGAFTYWAMGHYWNGKTTNGAKGASADRPPPDLER
ncbi:MAG: ion channel [Aestuariivirga sp.]